MADGLRWSAVIGPLYRSVILENVQCLSRGSQSHGDGHDFKSMAVSTPGKKQRAQESLEMARQISDCGRVVANGLLLREYPGNSGSPPPGFNPGKTINVSTPEWTTGTKRLRGGRRGKEKQREEKHAGTVWGLTAVVFLFLDYVLLFGAGRGGPED